MAAGNVPIYWGCPQIAEYVNPKRFINCHDFDSFDEVMEKVKEIDNDPALYEEYVAAPAILPDSLIYRITADTYERVQRIAEEAVARRSYRETKLEKSLRLFLMLIRGLGNYETVVFILKGKSRKLVRRMMKFRKVPEAN